MMSSHVQALLTARDAGASDVPAVSYVTTWGPGSSRVISARLFASRANIVGLRFRVQKQSHGPCLLCPGTEPPFFNLNHRITFLAIVFFRLFPWNCISSCNGVLFPLTL